MVEQYNYRERKIVVTVSQNLEAGVALNIVGHLSVSLAAHANLGELMGRDYLTDKSGVRHLGISKYPLIVTKAKPSKIRQAIEEARGNPNILFADYPKQMLDTGHDDELAEVIKETAEVEIDYLGAIFYGKTEDITQITGKFSLWK